MALQVSRAGPSTSECASLAHDAGYQLFGMTPVNDTAFQCLATAIANDTSAEVLMTSSVSNALCNTTCFTNGGSWPICGTPGYAFLFSIMSFNGSSSGGYSGPGSNSSGEQPLTCSWFLAAFNKSVMPCCCYASLGLWLR